MILLLLLKYHLRLCYLCFLVARLILLLYFQLLCSELKKGSKVALVALYSTHVVRLVAPPHLTKHIREEVLPDLQHLLLHARLHLTLLVHLLNRSPHLRHILLLLLILFPILWCLIQRAGAPTVPAPASTLAPFGLEDHQVPSNSL